MSLDKRMMGPILSNQSSVFKAGPIRAEEEDDVVTSVGLHLIPVALWSELYISHSETADQSGTTTSGSGSGSYLTEAMIPASLTGPGLI